MMDLVLLTKVVPCVGSGEMEQLTETTVTVRKRFFSPSPPPLR